MKPSVAQSALGVIAALYAATSSAQIAWSTGESKDINFRWGVPEGAAKDGAGNVYFQLNAPDRYSWVGLGIGTGMRDAQIFLMYQDGEGNVTLSTRAGKHHIMPEYTERTDLEILEGSGVVDGRMVANVRCGDCESLDLSGKNDWIAAWFNGDPLNSGNPSAAISFHGAQSKTRFNVDLARASVPYDRNPFSGSNLGEVDDDDDAVSSLDDINPGYDNVRLAHGIVMTVVFVGLYPLGALLMPVFGKWFLHSTSQLIAYLLMWAGVGLGVTYALHIDFLGKQAHTRLGLIVVCLLGLQPLLGWLHHRHYTGGGSRGLIGHIHVWFGRGLMVLGIVNGGLGLELAGNTRGAWVIAYSVVAGLMGVAYMGSILFSIIQKRRRKARRATKQLQPSDNPGNQVIQGIHDHPAEIEGSDDILLGQYNSSWPMSPDLVGQEPVSQKRVSASRDI